MRNPVTTQGRLKFTLNRILVLKVFFYNKDSLTDTKNFGKVFILFVFLLFSTHLEVDEDDVVEDGGVVGHVALKELYLGHGDQVLH